MASGQNSNNESNDREEFHCPICLELAHEPLCLKPCNHFTCKRCFELLKQSGSSKNCPLCRAAIASHSPHAALEERMRRLKSNCPGCSEQISLSSMTEHVMQCPVLLRLQRTGPQDKKQTYACPYCNMSSLSQKGLSQHCRKLHKSDNKRMVCPICASMPWGSTTKKSTNFIAHLRIRHSQDERMYVDDEELEEDIIAKVTQLSLVEM